jgi:hypothetical protein
MGSEETDHPRKRRDWNELVGRTLESINVIGASFTVAMLGLFVITMSYRYGTKIFWFLGRVLGRRGAEIVLVFFICVIGWLAHRFKQWQQGWYGLTEIVFGVVSAANIAFTMIPGSSTMPQWVGLFGSTYIIVRGLSNVSEVTSRKKNATLKSSTAP